jgi:gas vesicle protein
MSDQNSDFGSFLAGFVIGALVGAATALILAPQSGEATRRQIAGAGHDLRSAADDATREYLEKAEHVISDTRTRAQSLGDQVQSQTRIILDRGKDDITDATGNSTATA